MPPFLLKLILDLVLAVGWPIVLKYFPWIPKEVKEIIDRLIDALKGVVTTAEKKELTRAAKAEIYECVGIACPPSLKK